jgi:hypothetical protein
VETVAPLVMVEKVEMFISVTEKAAVTGNDTVTDDTEGGQR